MYCEMFMPKSVVSNYSDFVSEIRDSLMEIMESDSKSLIMGLGVTDPKGVFGTTIGLLEKFGSERVIETPTSENAVTGIGVGLAINGYRPIMIHQRMDFFLLAMDQLVNSAAKWHYMYGGEKSVPLTIRLITGRGWGQGPTHSQNLHAWFAHIPGLKVVMPAFAAEAKALLTAATNDPNPVLFIEDRWVHNQIFEIRDRIPQIELGVARKVTSGNTITVVSSGYMTIESLKASNFLKKFGVDVELIDLRTVKPYDKELVLESVKKTGKLVIVDSGNEFGSFGNQIVSDVVRNLFDALTSSPIVIASRDVPEPTSYGVIGSFKIGAITIATSILSLLKIDVKAEALMELEDLTPDVPDKNFTGPF